MKSKSKIWLGVGAFVVAGTGAVAAGVLPDDATSKPISAPGFTNETAVAPASAILLAQQEDHPPPPADGENGEAEAIANLPPDLAFEVRIALLRGHLLIGDELVKQQQWNGALPHFLHPTEEIYGDIKDRLTDFKVPPFDTALKALADVVKAKKGGADYAKAQKPVYDALAAAEAGMKAKETDWSGFEIEAAVEAMKTAASEYDEAIVNGKIVKPVEYQDARGFIWQADGMIEGVAADLQKKNANSLKQVRAGVAELKKVFPTAVSPRVPVKDHAAMLEIVARIELAAGKLM